MSRLPVLTLLATCLLSAGVQAAAPANDSATLNKIRDAALQSDWAYERLADMTDLIGPRLSGSPGEAAAVAEFAKAIEAAGITWKDGAIAGGDNSGQIVDQLGQGVSTLGTTLISRLKEEGHAFPMIMLTGYGDVRTATQAMKLGAADFVEKPYEPSELLASIDGAISKARDSSQVADGIREARRMLRMLTERESEIVDAIVAGSSSKQIAEALGVTIDDLV